MNPQIQRARLLMQHQRWEMAVSELGLALTEDHDNAEAHALLAFCLLQQEKYDRAEAEARTAVSLAPDHPDGFQTLALVLLHRRDYSRAAETVRHAIELDPYDPESFALLAQVEAALEHWPATLEAAESALKIDPEHLVGNNMRAMALVKLGRRAEAGQTLDAGLARNPQDAFTHANQGWALLEAGDRKQAFEHFRESLAQDPEMEWSRAGIVEAMKARNPVYRILLSFTLAMLKMSPGARWGIVIGGYILQRLLASFAEANPAYAPYCLPLLIAYGAFALFTWLGYPLFNLLLLTDKFGRRVLSRDQIAGALLVGALLLTPILLIAGFAVFPWAPVNSLGIWAAVNIGLVSIPASILFICDKGWPRLTMGAIVCAILGLALIPLIVWLVAVLWPTAPVGGLARRLLEMTEKLFVPSLIGSQFVGIGLAQARPRR